MNSIKMLIVAAATMLTFGTASAGGLCTKIHDTDWHGFAAEPRAFQEGRNYALDTDFYVFNASHSPKMLDVVFTDNNGREIEQSMKLGAFDWKRFRGIALDVEQEVLPYRDSDCLAFLKNRQTNIGDQTLKLGLYTAGGVAVVGAGLCIAGSLGLCAPAVGGAAGAGAGVGAASGVTPWLLAIPLL